MLAGVLQLTEDVVLPDEALMPVGALGTVAGVAVAVADPPAPDALLAVTVKVYCVPLVRPVNVQVSEEVLVHPAGGVTVGVEVTE